MSIDNSKKSPRLLQSRRYTHDTFTDAQEAFTSVLDINSDEVYIDQNLIPSSSIPYGTSGDNLSVYSSGGQQVMKYYYRYKMTKSSTNNEVWFFTTGTTAGIDAQLIDSNQQVNFISPKYSIPSLSTANAEDATPGYGVKVFVSTNSSAPSAGDQIASTKFVFDYKTGVLQFVLTGDAPTNSQYVYISAYQYVGRKLSNSLTSFATTGSNLFKGNQTISGSLIVGTGSLNVIAPEILHVENSGSYNIARFDGNHTNYAQINVQNKNTGSSASGDIVITADNGTENVHFVDLGINSSTYTAGYVGNANDAYLINAGKDLYVGTVGGSGHPSNLNLFAQNNWQNPQIQISGSKQISFNTGSVSSGYTYEFSGSAKFDHNVNVVGDVTVIGTITAKEIHTSIVTSSVLYESGSTKFGNSLDDTHQFTGSVLIDNLLNVNRITPLNGSNVTVESSNLLVPNGGIYSSFNIYASGSISASVISGSGAGLVNVPFRITGSDVDGNQSDKTFTKLHFDSDTGLNVSESAPGTAFISIGSHFKDIFVSGSPILSATGSDAFEIIGQGGVGITTSITDTNGNGYTKELKISTTTLSSSLNTRMDTITGSITTLSSSLNTRINTISGSVNSLNTFSSSVVLTSQTSSMSVMSASYALTAAFALNAGAGGSGGSSGAAMGSYNSLVVTSAASTWSFQHNSGQRYPIFQVFDNNGYVVIPSQIITIDDDNANIIFPSPQTGRVIASLGAGNGTTQAFTNSNLWVVDHNLGTDYPDVTVWDSNRNIVFPNRIESVNTNQIKIYFSQAISGNVSVSRGGHILSGSANTISGVVSGSAQIVGLGFATTGSNTFTGSQTINGCLTLNNAKICSTGTTISSNTQIFDLSTFDGAFFDYVVKNGVNMRAGNIMSVWDGTNSSYNETTTTDLGNTNAIGFNVSGTGKLNATISSGTWTVEVLYRALGGGSTPTSTNYSISSGYNAPNYCDGLSGPFSTTVYGNNSVWTSVTRFYTDSGMTTPFNGNSKYYGDSTAYFGTTLQIDSSGYVINSYAC